MEKLFEFLSYEEDIKAKIKLKKQRIEHLQREIEKLEEILNNISSNQNKSL